MIIWCRHYFTVGGGVSLGRKNKAKDNDSTSYKTIQPSKAKMEDWYLGTIVSHDLSGDKNILIPKDKKSHKEARKLMPITISNDNIVTIEKIKTFTNIVYNAQGKTISNSFTLTSKDDEILYTKIGNNAPSDNNMVKRLFTRKNSHKKKIQEKKTRQVAEEVLLMALYEQHIFDKTSVPMSKAYNSMVLDASIGCSVDTLDSKKRIFGLRFKDHYFKALAAMHFGIGGIAHVEGHGIHNNNPERFMLRLGVGTKYIGITGLFMLSQIFNDLHSGSGLISFTNAGFGISFNFNGFTMIIYYDFADKMLRVFFIGEYSSIPLRTHVENAMELPMR